MIEGLADDYKDAMEYLCEHYDKPRLIHHEYVRSIVEAPSLKEGSGRELRCLHDVPSRHLHALTTRYPYEPFVTARIKLKLHVNQPSQPILSGKGTVGVSHVCPTCMNS